MGKKAQARIDAKNARPYTMTPAQELMRDDIQAGPVTLGAVFDEELGGSNHNELDREDENEVRNFLNDDVGEAVEGELDSVLNEYGVFSRTVPSIAYTIIEGYDLVLGLKQWQQVQAMVEDGIREGYRTHSDAS